MMTSEVLHSIAGLKHAFGTRENPLPLGRDRLPDWKQVHGASFAEARHPGEKLGEVDAIWTRSTQVTIGVVTADCVPILLSRKDGQRVAAVHAGWRGTQARILKGLWEFFESDGERAADWVAAIGPAIGSCCYEVSPELALDFKSRFCEGVQRLLDLELALPAPRMLDLPAINEAELQKIGFYAVDRLNFCTRCTIEAHGKPLFYSYRANPGEGRQQSQIQRLD